MPTDYGQKGIKEPNAADAKPAAFGLFYGCINFQLPQGAEGFQRATGKPFGRLRRGEILCDTEKKGRPVSCLPQGSCFLWEVSPASGRARYFPRAGKYPKGAGGGQRVHVSWPPPDPPLLSNNAPLASQGRAQLALHPSLGGPLSPSAQLIPPPAVGRRFIPGVIARNHCGRKTLLRYVPQLRCHAKCASATAPDWLLAQGQTKWRVRYGSCRSSNKGKYPLRHKGGPGVSLGRLKGV